MGSGPIEGGRKTKENMRELKRIDTKYVLYENGTATHTLIVPWVYEGQWAIFIDGDKREVVTGLTKAKQRLFQLI